MAKFSARHYVAIAKIVRELHTTAIDSGDLYLQASTEDFADRLIETFRRDNPRFAPDRFRQACRSS